MLINVRDPLLALAMQADEGAGELHNTLTIALPRKTSKKVKESKKSIVTILIKIFFGVDQLVRSGVELPGRHSALSKALTEFCIPMIRVRDLCLHQLADEATQFRALKSEPVSGKFVLCPPCQSPSL